MLQKNLPFLTYIFEYLKFQINDFQSILPKIRPKNDYEKLWLKAFFFENKRSENKTKGCETQNELIETILMQNNMINAILALYVKKERNCCI